MTATATYNVTSPMGDVFTVTDLRTYGALIRDAYREFTAARTPRDAAYALHVLYTLRPESA